MPRLPINFKRPHLLVFIAGFSIYFGQHYYLSNYQSFYFTRSNAYIQHSIWLGNFLQHKWFFNWQLLHTFFKSLLPAAKKYFIRSCHYVDWSKLDAGPGYVGLCRSYRYHCTHVIFNIGTGIVFPLATAGALLEHRNMASSAGAIIGSLQMLIVTIISLICSLIITKNQYSLALPLLAITSVCFLLAIFYQFFLKNYAFIPKIFTGENNEA